MTRIGIPALACALLWAGGCGGSDRAFEPYGPPRPHGPGPRYRPPPLGTAAAAGAPIDGLRCSRPPVKRFGAHLEIFDAGLVVAIPPGIGIAAPHQRRGAYVRAGRCSYPVRTTEPTGVIEVAAHARVTLGQFFDVWGQPLSRERVAGFDAAPGERVAAFVAGRRWRGDPRAIPLHRHAVIVLEVGAHVPPHRTYFFPPGM
ncbi:MAG: hypothetical protein QOD76_1079 [Solirubrobacteraceae bacterium]|nr:hypothetical protein [Solirubrobacteraceae bacterium]